MPLGGLVQCADLNCGRLGTIIPSLGVSGVDSGDGARARMPAPRVNYPGGPSLSLSLSSSRATATLAGPLPPTRSLSLIL
jgi:hypothetical protein